LRGIQAHGIVARRIESSAPSGDPTELPAEPMSSPTGDCIVESLSAGVATLDAPERVRALAQSGLLDLPVDPAFDRLTALAATTLCVPVALVTLVDAKRQFFASSYGLRDPWAARRETPLTHSFCQYVVRTRAPVVITDAHTDPRVAGNLALPELGVVAYVGCPILGADGTVLGSFAIADTAPREWTERETRSVAAFASLATREVALGRMARATAALLEHASDAFVALDADWRVTSCNPAAQTVFGVGREVLVGRVAWDALPAPAIAALEPVARQAAVEHAPVEVEAELPPSDAATGVRWLEVRAIPGPDGVAILARDVTARVRAERALRESEAQFRHQALHDPLTGLANRALFSDRVAHALTRASRDGTAAAVLYLDLDGFKRLNDTLGHAAGDECLATAAERLRGAVRTNDTVARLGGDEFAVLLEGTHADEAEAEAVEVARRVVAALRAPVVLEGRGRRLSASVGIAAAGGRASSADLLRRADRAMYAAKAGGGNRYEVAGRSGEWRGDRIRSARAD
jgi:diguanylate cyclase (GGDEF)-like protein/PAS domain S-box-containing protein